MTAAALLEVVDLELSYRHDDGWLQVLNRVSFEIARGETFGLVGESGCGKSTVALQLLGYRNPASRIDGGRVMFDGRDLLRLRRSELDRLRGDRVSFVPQNPTTALNPGIRVGEQIVEILRQHGRAATESAALDRVAELFDLVGLPAVAQLGGRYPHQLSGGQQQRVCIAMALACEPDLVVLDEPTTGLDVTTQEQIVELLADLRSRLGMSMLYVTHDLGLLSQIADRVGVMYAGHMVEIAPTAELFRQPRHPYTRGLIASIPRIDGVADAPAHRLRGLLRRHELPAGCPFAPRCDFAEPSCATNPQSLEPVTPDHRVACQRWRALGAPSLVAADGASQTRRTAERTAPALLTIDNVTIGYGRRGGRIARLLGAGSIVVARDFSLEIGHGETVALVGESGSGKSTVARAVTGLIAPEAGRILLDGKPLPGLVQQRSGEQRRQIQYIFQNPDASLNPRATVGSILARPLEMFFDFDRAKVRERVAQALQDVQLDAGYAERYPDQLSGGERQRVAVARALIAGPELLLCDEILSALDVSVQASVLDLLRRLRAEHGVAMLFISHDLAVVRQLADRVGVMFGGQLMEIGRTADIFAPPFHPYTHSLLLAVPSPDKPLRRETARLRGRPQASATGCAFAGRCPWQPGPVCDSTPPPWRQPAGSSLRLRCHLSLDELTARATWKPAGAALPPMAPAPRAQDRPA